MLIKDMIIRGNNRGCVFNDSHVHQALNNHTISDLMWKGDG